MVMLHAAIYIGWPPPALVPLMIDMQGKCKVNAEPSSLELC